MSRRNREIDRSKYRNPDLPPGYEKKKARLEYVLGGEDFEGEHFILAPYINNSGVDNCPEFQNMADFEFYLSDEEEIASGETAVLGGESSNSPKSASSETAELGGENSNSPKSASGEAAVLGGESSNSPKSAKDQGKEDGNANISNASRAAGANLEDANMGVARNKDLDNQAKNEDAKNETVK